MIGGGGGGVGGGGGGGGAKGGPSKVRQRTAGGIGVAVSPQMGPGWSPKISRFVWVVESLNHPLLFETNTKDAPHMKFIFVETDAEY